VPWLDAISMILTNPATAGPFADQNFEKDVFAPQIRRCHPVQGINILKLGNRSRTEREKTLSDEMSLQRAESRLYFQICSACKLIIWLFSFSEDGQKDMRSKHGKYPAA
jgi:hypothetical protein